MGVARALFSLTQRDFGFNRLLRDAQRKGATTVGVHEEEGAEVYDNSDVTIATVAFFQEVGTSTIPARSWLDEGIDENQSEINETMRRLGRRIVKRTMTPDRAHNVLGEFVVLRLQARIRKGIPPPLAPSTLIAKTVGGRTGATPLIDSGRLLASIRHKVET